LYGRGVKIGLVQSQLWVYPTRGDTPSFRLLQGEAIESDGQFSPNGQWVAYCSNRSGQNEVYVTQFHEHSSSREQRHRAVLPAIQRVSIEGGRQPRWRRDGKELFYLADSNLMAVSISMRGAKLEIGTPHILFRANPLLNDYQSSYDVLSNGSKFIVNSL